MDNITLANTMLANTLRDSLIENASKGKFKSIVNDVLTSPKFRKALNAAEALFGAVSASPVRRKKAKKVKAHKRGATKKAAKVVDPNAPKPKRGRPKGSKNKPKVAPVTENASEVTETGLTFTDMELATETV